MWSPTICIVSHDRTARETMRATLEAERWNVIEAEDGLAALEHVEREAPDLVIQDLELPDMSGVDLLRRLRMVPGCDDLSAIAVSCTAARIDEARAGGAGFATFLLEPVHPALLVAAARAQLPFVPAAEVRPGEGRRVLAVEDDPTQLKLLRIHLGGLGFRVTTAANGRSALRKARENPPDAIVSDVLMPELDGFGLCLHVRRDPKLAGIPIVLQSSHFVDEADRLLARGVGANRMIVRSTGAETMRVLLDLLGGPTPRPVLPVAGIEREHSMRLVRQLERQVAANRELAQRCTDLATQLTTMRAVGDALECPAGVRPALREVFAGCLEGSGVGWGGLYVVGADRELELRHSIGYTEAQAGELRELFGYSALLRQVVSTGIALSIPSATLPEEDTRELLCRAGVSSILLLPIPAGQSCQGLLFLGSSGSDVTAPDVRSAVQAVGDRIGEALGLANALERLARSEEWHRRIVETTQEGVWMIDGERCTTFVNSRMARMLGTTVERMRGASLIDRICEEDRPRATEGIDRVLSGASLQTEVRFVGEGGVELPAILSADPIFEEGRLAGALVLVTDASREREARARLLVEDRMASAELLASGVAHEINNPLAAVLTNLEVAAEDVAALEHRVGEPLGGLGDEIRDAREAAQRVGRIVRQLRIFSPSAGGRRERVDVLRVLESSERLAARQITGRARLVTQYRPIPPVDGTEAQLGQVFLNLLVNAGQAIPEGNPAENQVVIATDVDAQGRVVVTIEDTGCGMSREVIDRLFTPFFTTREFGSGKGLGLSICQRIVASLGGEIQVESQVGRGTKLTVRLPAAVDQPFAQLG